MYGFVLAIHLLTAATTGVVLLYSLYALVFKKANSYQVCALLLGFVASLEVVTGVALSELSPTLTEAALSLHLFEYLGACLFVEVLLFTRIKRLVAPVLSS